MRYMKRALSMLLVTALLFPLVACSSGEDMTFTYYDSDGKWRLFHLDGELNPELLWEGENRIAYEDGVAVYVGLTDSVRWDLLAVKNGEKTVLIEGMGTGHNYNAARLQLVDGNIYVPLHTITENNQIIDIPLLICSLGGTQQRIMTDMNLNPFGLYQVLDEKVYYLENDTWLPMVYDLKTGEKQALPELEPILISTYTYIDDGRFWYAWADGDLEAYDRDELEELHVYVVGISAEDEDVIKVPFDEWLDNSDYYVHDGWLYYFRNRRLADYEDPADTVAELYRKNIKTLKEECICTEITYDNNFPPALTFGKNGIVYIDEVWEGEQAGYVQRFWYIPYDGSGKIELKLQS